jgi:hypothetical protein
MAVASNQLTQVERLTMRLMDLARRNAGSVFALYVVADANGTPLVWWTADAPRKVEGIDDKPRDIDTTK